MAGLLASNTTYSSHLPKETENLLKISTAFETLIKTNREKGKEDRLKELLSELKKRKLKKLSTDQKNVIENYLQEKLTSQLAKKIEKISGSQKLGKWFSEHLYATGSTIRHGDEIDLYPSPRDAGKRQKGKSLWYGEGASHHFLSNVYFGRRLYKFIFRELHFLASRFVKELEVQNLEKLLVSDEQRLKELEKYIFGTKEGELDWKELRICGDLGRSYSGDKKRIFILLQRLLKEIQASFPKVWREIKNHAEIIIKADPYKVKFDDFEGFKPYYDAVIDVDSALHSRHDIYSDESEFKLFNIKNFVSFSVHRLL